MNYPMQKVIKLPFSREIVHAHGTIRSLVEWLDAELQRQSRDGYQTNGPILGPFRVLRQHLCEHFDYEERLGFFSASKDMLPEAKSEIDLLVLQHASFRERMQAIEESLEEAAKRDQAPMENVVEDMRCFFQDLRFHDLEEARLLKKLETEDVEN